MFIKAIKNKVVQYPYTWEDLRNDNPNVGIPYNADPATLASFNVYNVLPTQAPHYDASKEIVVETTPVYKDKIWMQAWTTEPVSSDEALSNMEKLEKDLYKQLQEKLDNFARERGYSSINDACTYSLSSIKQYKLEGEYCVQIRDQMWSSFVRLIEDKKQGLSPVFYNDFNEYLKYLPPLQWPDA